jgi:dolichyl-diphosphooligosaccharide--protein glycosyltransferase
VDAEGTPTLLNSLMYKLSYYKFGEFKVSWPSNSALLVERFHQVSHCGFLLQLDYRSPAGFDRTRNVIIGNKNFELTYLEEAYTTEHWLVRIYK